MAAPGRTEETCGPGAGTVCVRLPAKPIKSVTVRKPPGREFQKRRPGCRHGSRLTSRKANKLGFLARTPGPEFQKRWPGCRPENGKTLHRQQLLDDAGFSHYLLFPLRAHYLLLPLRAVLGLILKLGCLLQLDFCGHFFAVPLHREGDGVSHLLLLNGLN